METFILRANFPTSRFGWWANAHRDAASKNQLSSVICVCQLGWLGAGKLRETERFHRALHSALCLCFQIVTRPTAPRHHGRICGRRTQQIESNRIEWNRIVEFAKARIRSRDYRYRTARARERERERPIRVRSLRGPAATEIYSPSLDIERYR